MAANKKPAVSLPSKARRQSGAERRAAQIEMVATKQAQLKQEAAERRLTRASLETQKTSPPRSRVRRRGTAR